MKPTDQIRSLINRLARLDAARAWQGDLNPAQVEGLSYLSRANRFSRAPSHVADYLGTTRGTASQTLKALLRKGYLIEQPSQTDKRSISYDLSDKGHSAIAQANARSASVDRLSSSDKAQIIASLETVLRARLAENGGRSFGLCKTCHHHQMTESGPFCALLSQPLRREEVDQICHEHAVG